MSGDNRNVIREYLNLLAVVCHCLKKYTRPAVSILALESDDNTEQENLLIRLRNLRMTCDDVHLVSELSSLVSDIAAYEDHGRKYLHLYTVCKWMDSIITYEPHSDKSHFSIYGIVGDYSSKDLRIYSLNSNYEETQVVIGPKFPVFAPYSEQLPANQSGNDNDKDDKENVSNDIRANPLANRDAFAGMNGVLLNITVLTWDPYKKVRHVITSLSKSQRCRDANSITIACAPMTDNPKCIEIQTGRKTEDGFSFRSLETSIRRNEENSKALNKRLVEDWRAACTSAKADVLMFPEVVGTDQSFETMVMPNGDEYNLMIHSLHQSTALEKVPPPLLVIMANNIGDGTNRAAILGSDGIVLGYQNKYEPFVSRGQKRIESLEEHSQREYTIIHIPGVHRIVVLLCSEFVDICEHGPMDLFEEACATLVLVPSFSLGESDFMNVLQSLRKYGTSVVWGNCCGASKKPLRRIGGCSPTDTYTIQDFKSVRRCDGTCSNIKSCIFSASLPLRISIHDETEGDELRHTTVHHHIK